MKAAAQALGGWRGGPAPDDAARARAATVKAERADRLAADLAPMLAQLRAEGAASLAALAAGLNARTVPAPRGGSWTATGVRRLLARAG